VDTDGCILVGTRRGSNVVANSRAAFRVLFAKLTAAIGREKILMEVVGGPTT